MRQSLRHYHVFISYRHNDRDKRIAEELQKCLEKYKVRNPKTGQMEWLTVFRDQSELPTSNDLGKDIEMALEASDYLVIICSKDYQKSIWCMRELSYFRNLHNNSNVRILPIITDGEPEECFPPELCFREEAVYSGEALQTVQIPVEPMAADVRGANLSEQIKKLRFTEYMRIAAPVLGVPFDALYQRRARSRFQKILAAVFAALVLATGFGIYNFSVNQKLTVQQTEILEADSRNLARTAQLLLEKGQRKQALEAIVQAFPSENQNRPIVPEAVQMLHETLYTYHAPGYRVNQVHETYYAIEKAVLSRNERYLVTIESNSDIVCYDLQSQKEIWRIKRDYNFYISAPELYLLPGGDAVLLVEPYSITQDTCVSRISIVSGETEWTQSIGNHHPVLSPDGSMLAYVLTAYDDIAGGIFGTHIYDIQTGNEIKKMQYSPEKSYLTKLGSFGFSEDGQAFFLVTEQVETSAQQFAELTVYNLKGEMADTIYTAKAGAYMHHTDLGEKYGVDIFPLADACGNVYGYYYKISLLNLVKSRLHGWETKEGTNTVLLTGAIFAGNPENNFRCCMEFPFRSGGFSMVSTDYLGAFPLGQDIVFISDKQMVKYNPDSGRKTLFCREDFPSPAIRCFSKGEQVFSILQDGTISQIGMFGVSPRVFQAQQDAITSSSCSMATVSENGGMVLISDGNQQMAMICHQIGDPTGIESPLEEYVYCSSLRPENALTIISTGDNLHATLMDTENMNIRTQSQEYLGGLEFQGTTADKKLIILDGRIWDLTTNSIMDSADYPWQEHDLRGVSFLASGQSILSHNFKWKQNVPPVLQWWYNGEPIDVPTEYQGKPILDGITDSEGIDSTQESAFLIGQNGLLAAKMNFCDSYGTGDRWSYLGLLVFSATDRIWRYVPSGSEVTDIENQGGPYCAFAKKHPWIGIPELDGVLRIYDWNTDSYIHQHDLQIPGSLVRYMSFFGNDRYMLLTTSRKIIIVDLKTGEITLEQDIISYGGTTVLTPCLCTEFGDHLAICLNKDAGYGFCINTKTWQIENQIPGLVYMNDSAVLTLCSGRNSLILYPKWNTEDLLTAARKELSEYSSE